LTDVLDKLTIRLNLSAIAPDLSYQTVNILDKNAAQKAKNDPKTARSTAIKPCAP
jgi:hypothetical protein